MLNAACNCLALVNQTYFANGWGANWPEALRLPLRPNTLEATAEALLACRDIPSVVNAADELAAHVLNVLRHEMEAATEAEPAAGVFRDSDAFILEYVNKILSACRGRDLMKARQASPALRGDLGEMLARVEGGPAASALPDGPGRAFARAGLPELLELAARGDLPGLAERVIELDRVVRAWLTGNSVELNALDDLEALRRFLEERDPLPR